MQSGTPFTISDSGGAAFSGTSGSRANFAPGATAASAQKTGRVEDRLTGYFDTMAFTRSGNFFGNTGRDILRGPRQRNVNFAVNKRIFLTERLNAELRSEFFNIFNMVNFGSAAGSIASSGFGIIRTREGNPRVIQFGLKLVL